VRQADFMRNREILGNKWSSEMHKIDNMPKKTEAQKKKLRQAITDNTYWKLHLLEERPKYTGLRL
jgi:hypothetical protein